MLTTLTSYLLQTKQVVIPHVGSFELRHQPATLDFASRLIMPPAEVVVFAQNDEVKEPQLRFMSEAMHVCVDEVSQQLYTLGKQLKASLAKQAFEWRGIGRLEQGVSGIVFQSLLPNVLKPVEAHRVVRENTTHSVTIGDREMQSHEAAELLQEEAGKSYLMVIVWILIALALLFIGYLFYTKGFSPLSSGSQQRFGYLQQHIADGCKLYA